MKVICFIVVSIIFTIIGSQAQECTRLEQYGFTLSPSSDKLIFIANVTYNVVWLDTTSKDLTMNVTVCASNNNDFNALVVGMDNQNDGVHLVAQLGGSLPSSTSSGASSTGSSGGRSTTSSSTTSSPALSTGPLSPGVSSRPSLVSLLLIVLASMIMSSKANKISIASGLFVLAATASVGIVDATYVNITVHVPASMNTLCVGGTCYNRSASGNVSNYINIFGARYALVQPLDNTGKCDPSIVLQIPTGWRFADSTPESFIAIYLGPWKPLYAIGLSNLKTYLTSANGVELPADYVTPQNPGYKINSPCDTAVMITQAFPVPEGNRTIIRTPQITNYRTFNGYDYATADNAAFTDGGQGTQSYSTFVDESSWQVAPEEGASLIAIQSSSITFGALCILMASGNSFTSSLSSGPCASGIQQLISTPYNGGNIYTVNGGGSKKILLRRPSSHGNSWTPRVNITNLLPVGGKDYALIDNNPTANEQGQCQQNFMSLPVGYSLATPEQIQSFITFNKRKYFPSTYCFVTQGAAFTQDGSNCTATLLTQTVSGVPFYTTTTCARVMIVRN